ncbi:MAG: LiaF-related protein [Firmicutes bacterium]|nr:LiaF-related protein [Bacillota bacterium]
MKSKILFGIVFVVVGIIFGLQELGLITNIGLDGSIIFPIIMIIIGITILVNNHNIIFGGLVTFLGLVYLIDGWYPQVHKIIFPGILVIIGIEIIFGSLFKKSSHPRDNISIDNDDEINAIAVLGGVEKKIISQNFRGGKASAFLGGVVLDLTEIKLASDAIIDVNAFMGGVEIRLPSNIRIKSNVNGFLGGVEIKHRPSEITSEFILVLKGTALMGGIEVK